MNEEVRARKRAAEKFVEYWSAQKGAETGEDQKFWNSLLREVFEVEQVESFIEYQVPVHYKGTTKRLDAWIPSTGVLIEHKTRGINLDTPQTHHEGMTPFQQAKDYNDNRLNSERARWIVVCNFDELRIHDMNVDVSGVSFVKIALKDLPREIHRLNFLVESENAIRSKELEVSVKAGRVVGKLYNSFLEDLGPENAQNPEVLKNLNKLCVRLVFCVYAEDSGVFAKDQFLNFLRKFHYASIHLQLTELFKVLRLKPEERGPFFSAELKDFPYVGGGLFQEDIPIAPFSERTASILLNDASEQFDWSEISPTIFGAVFESTLNPETRRQGGMHYTSEENIHKVIDPLFLNALREELAAIRQEPNLKKRGAALDAFQEKLAGLKFLDPACGSGNFLTETYISLRKLENEVLSMKFKGQGQLDLGDKQLVRVSINQFHGIEINDFAVTVAQTAMWIAECKMMESTCEILSKNLTPLPLTDSAKIVEGNALRMDWGGPYDYIMGNPPFIGAMLTSAEQKADMIEVFGKEQKMLGEIDYVAAWYKKSADLIQGTNIRCAFVSTNSITQGQQASSIWPRLPIKRIFAHRTFIWDSEAIEKAHVHVVVIGFVATSCTNLPLTLRIFDGEQVFAARQINAYLMDAPDVDIASRSKPLCEVPPMCFGNMPRDGGNLIIEAADHDEFVRRDPEGAKFIKPLLGAEEYINGKKRYCLWLVGVSPGELRKCPLVMQRINACREMRLASKAAATRKFADIPHLFCQITQPEGKDYIAVPRVSSERRKYIPIGFLDAGTKVTDLLQIIPCGNIFHFGVLTSSVHMAWMRTVAGRLKSDYRYSKDVVYNNFPWPERTTDDESRITATAQAILDARAKYPDSSLADLYDPLTMPPELRKAHRDNDRAVLAAYGFPETLTESEIVSRLFELYADLVKKVSA